VDLTFLWVLLKGCAAHTGGMRTLLAWTGAAALSVLLGVILYSTSLQGSQAGYQESSPLITESPSASTVIRQPETGMSQKKTEPVAPQVAVPPAEPSVVVPAPAYTPPPSSSSDDSNKKRDHDSSEDRDEGRDDD